MSSVRKIKLPLSFPPYAVNAYLIETGKSRILFDSGPRNDQVIEILKKEVDNFGGIDVVILSHGHLDHAGNAKAVSDFYDVPVYASFHEKARLSEDFQKRLERRVKKTIKLLNFFCFSDEVAKRELEKANFYKEQMEPLELVFNISTFDDPEVTILELPGHTKGSVGLFLKSDRLIFTGDAFLKDGISSFFDPEEPRDALKDYFSSLQKIMSLQPQSVFPGHGDSFDNPEAVYEEKKNYVDLIIRKIKEIIDKKGKIAGEVTSLFPSGYNALIAMSELVYALESLNIGILQSLKDLLSE